MEDRKAKYEKHEVYSLIKRDQMIVNVCSVAIAAIIIFASFTIKGIILMDDVSVFLTIMGLTLGLIAAFKVSQVSERFSVIRSSIVEEISSLRELMFLASGVCDKKTLNKLRKNIIDYTDTVLLIKWEDYFYSKEAKDRFESIFELIKTMKVNGSKAESNYQSILDTTANLRTNVMHQLVLGNGKTKPLQWLLLIFLSLSVMITLMMTTSPVGIISPILTAAMNISIFLILFLIYDIDSLLYSVYDVTVMPYLRLQEDLKALKI